MTINLTAADTTDEVEEALTRSELDKVKKKSLAGVASFFVKTIIIQGVGLASSLILSAYFSPEDFGVYGFVIQIIGMLVFFSDIGLAAALIQKRNEPTLEDYQTAFTAQQILSWLIFAIVMIIIMSGVISEKTGSAGMWILISLGLSFPLATLQTISRIKLERQLDFSKLVIPQIVEQISFHSILIYLAITGTGAIAYAYAIFVRSILGAAVMFGLGPWQIGFSLKKESLKELLNFGVKFQLNDFLARIKDQLFFLALGLWFPLREFGYINWAKNWSIYPYNLTVQSVMAITFPTFSRLQGDKNALRRAIEISIFFITLLIFPILVGMSTFIAPLVAIFPAYQKWTPALMSLVLFSLSVGWGAISSPLTNTLNAIGHINKTLKLMIMWTVLTWIVTPICIYFWGYLLTFIFQNCS